MFDNIINRLKSLYPYVNNHSDIFYITINSKLNIKPNNTFIINNFIQMLTLYNNTKYINHNNDLNLNDIINDDIFNLNIHLQCNTHENSVKLIDIVKTYSTHKLSDFKLVCFAANFYNTTIDQLSNDFNHIMNYDNMVNNLKICIDNINLKNDILHIINCSKLLIVGFVFFHFKISIILENHCRMYHEFIIEKIISNKIKYSDITINKIIDNKLLQIKKFIDINDTNDLLLKYNKIYDIFEPMIDFIKTKNSFSKYIKQNADLMIEIPIYYNKPVSLKKNLKNNFNYYHLAIVFKYLNLESNNYLNKTFQTSNLVVTLQNINKFKISISL